MKKTRFGGFFFVWIICARQYAGNNVLRSLSSVALEVAEAEAN
jgi:hypothetical protein